jgi:hypothetical protein
LEALTEGEAEGQTVKEAEGLMVALLLLLGREEREGLCPALAVAVGTAEREALCAALEEPWPELLPDTVTERVTRASVALTEAEAVGHTEREAEGLASELPVLLGLGEPELLMRALEEPQSVLLADTEPDTVTSALEELTVTEAVGHQLSEAEALPWALLLPEGRGEREALCAEL